MFGLQTSALTVKRGYPQPKVRASEKRSTDQKLCVCSCCPGKAYLPSPSLSGPATQSPSSLVSQMISSSAASLPWLALPPLGRSAWSVQWHRCMAIPLIESWMLRHRVLGSTTTTAGQMIQVNMGTRPMAQVHSSTPKMSQASWIEVVHCS